MSNSEDAQGKYAGGVHRATGYFSLFFRTTTITVPTYPGKHGLKHYPQFG